MKKLWIFLLMLPLFCISGTDADMTESRAVKIVPSERKTTARPGFGASTSANASSYSRLLLVQNDNSPYRRQVYRRKHSTGIKSLSGDQISDRIVFDPSAENARNRKTASAGIRTTSNSAELARWKASQKNQTRKFVPSDVFRKFSLVSSSGRVSSFRIGGRKRSSVHVRRSSVHRTRTRTHRR